MKTNLQPQLLLLTNQSSDYNPPPHMVNLNYLSTEATHTHLYGSTCSHISGPESPALSLDNIFIFTTAAANKVHIKVLYSLSMGVDI